MSTDSKQTVSWIYELNKEQLVHELEKRELPITGNSAVLRQRLLQAVRSTVDPYERPPTYSGEGLDHTLNLDTRIKSTGSSFETRKVSIASQTEMDFSYFRMLDGLISLGKLPCYTRSPGVEQDQRPVDINVHKNLNNKNQDPHSRTSSPTYPHSRRSHVAFEDPHTPHPHSHRSHGSNYHVPLPNSMHISRPMDDYDSFESQTPSNRTRTSFSRMQPINDDVCHRDSDYPSPRYNDCSSSSSNSVHAYEMMRKWNIRYSGTRNDDPDAFLTRIEEGRDLVPISDVDLLRVIPFFLTGIALSWFRSSKHLWRTFNQFAPAFKVRFGDSDFQFEIRQEIHQRTQGEKESVSDYLTCMRVMFDRLNPRMTESEEISYAHRNLIPRLHLAINRNDINDFTHLEYLANTAQKSYRIARSYKPPPTPERSLLPDLAYKDPKNKRTDKQYDTRTEGLTSSVSQD